MTPYNQSPSPQRNPDQTPASSMTCRRCRMSISIGHGADGIERMVCQLWVHKGYTKERKILPVTLPGSTCDEWTPRHPE